MTQRMLAPALSAIVAILIPVSSATAQVCFERLPGQSCCWNATPAMPILFCDGVQCNPSPITDPPISIVIPGTYHINPNAWPPVVPAPTCTYNKAKCIDQDPPCGLDVKVSSTTCPLAVNPTNWPRNCEFFEDPGNP